MQATSTFDWGVIATAAGSAFAVTVPALLTFWRARIVDKKERMEQAAVVAKDAAEIKKIGMDTHVLVNDQLTREKASRLLDAEIQRELLALEIGNEPSPRQTELLVNLDRHIAAMAAEIRQRDIAAGTLSPDEEKVFIANGGTIRESEEK